MKQKIPLTSISSHYTGVNENSDLGNFDSSDVESLKFLTEELNRLTTLHQNLAHSYFICEDCGEPFCACGYFEELVSLDNSPMMRISIRLSYRDNKKMEEKIQVLKNEIETMKNNVQNLTDKFIRIRNSWQRLSQECSSLKINCQQQTVSINECQSKQDKAEQGLLDIRQQMKDVNSSSHDGSIIWIIEEYKKKFEQAASGQKTSIYSPIFYSSAFGYKMRVRLDLYGDGDAYGTHMSVFLVILQGYYDPILTWPFHFPVTFCLFDQTGEGYHIIDSFKPDATSNSFQRPRSKENIASGILKFVPLAIIQQQQKRFVPNDTMYIKAIVDFDEIPQAILFYTSSIDPGLPTHEQEAIRKRMIKQYNELRAKLVAQIAANDRELADRSLIPVHPPVPARMRQQTSPSTTNSEGIPCEDMLHQ